MKIAILDTCTVIENNDIDLSLFENNNEVRFYNILSKPEIIKNCKNAEAIICNKSIIDKEIMENCKNLKYIGLFATGYNNIDITFAKQKGITVCNAPNYSTNAVAQLVFSFILMFACKTKEYYNFVNNGNWILSSKFSCFPYSMCELQNKVLGIYGLGAIGTAVAKIATAFGMKIIAFTRTEKFVENVQLVSEQELFSKSDFLTVHCPLTKETENLINSQTLNLMKPSAYLINTSRGGVVNETDLANALNRNVIAGAGLDVLQTEPMNKNCPLYKAENCIITPHIAWAPKETRERLIKIVYQNIENFKKGTPTNNLT